MISQKKLNKKLASKQYIQEERKKLLDSVGYTDLKKKYGKSRRPEFPNYKIDSQYSLSNKVDENGLRKPRGAEHPDAIEFPVGNSHKQGLELIYSRNFAKDMNGKKT